MTNCPETISGEHDWLEFRRPAHTHNGDFATITTSASTGRVCEWCGEVAA